MPLRSPWPVRVDYRLEVRRLPFVYRQAGIFERRGLHLDRGTLRNWIGRACFQLMPVIYHSKAHLCAADRIFVDETRAPVLDPNRMTTKTG